MSYKIFIGKSKEAAVEVHLDGRTPAAIPKHILLGTGQKKPRYKAYLNDCYTKNSDLLKFLAFIHKTGKQHGSVALICTCKSKEKYHAESVKEFLEESAETLDAMLPYLFSDAGYKAPEVTEAQKPQLTKEDMDQINALIKQDQEKTRLAGTAAIPCVNSTPAES